MTLAHPRPYLAGSDFAPGPRRKLCREQRRLLLVRADLARRRGHITALHVEVLRALLHRLGVDGRLDPSHLTIGVVAGCCARTVRRALVRLAGLGLVAWKRRLVRTPGWRVAQTSNAYELLPEGRPIPARRPRVSCGGQGGRETSFKSFFKRVVAVSPADQLAALAEMDKMSADQRGRFVATWQAMRGSENPRCSDPELYGAQRSNV